MVPLPKDRRRNKGAASAEAAPEASAAQLGAILEDSINEIYVFDAETLRFTLVNGGARRNLGYSMEELLRLTPLDLKPGLGADAFEELLAPLRSGEASRVEFTALHRRKDGTRYPVEVHLHLSTLLDRPSFVAIILDISEREAQKERIEEMAARSRTILETAADAIITIDMAGVIVTVNQATQRLFGYDESELVGQNVRILMTPEDAAVHQTYIERYLRTGEPRIIGSGRELEARHRDGSVFPIRLSVGESLFDHTRLFTGIVHDLSHTRSLQQQLLQAQKMEAIGTLAGGVAHDFNNLLTSIRGSSEILLDRLDPEGAEFRAASRIRRASDRAAALTTRLLGFSRKQGLRVATFDLNRALRETSELFERTLAEDIDLKMSPGDGPLWVRADESQIAQVLMNLVVNAGDAMPHGGVLSLRTGRERLDPRRAELLGVSPGPFALVEVRDTGDGIPDDVRPRIFDPFYTTKAPDRGTGLGLSMALGIIREHGGVIEVDSEVGQGTTFTVYLPEVEAGTTVASAGVVAGPAAGRLSATVLLVEDDESARELFEELLRDAGCDVLAAGGPSEALELAAGAPDGIDVLVTDVVMPEMTGLVLAERLRAEHPGLAVLYISGYTDQILAGRGQLREEDPFLRKPFGRDALLEKLHEILRTEPA